jgi:uncharacterized integral membrane protein (TIGR00698 family)
MWASKIIFFALILFCLSPWGSAPLALAAGLALALTLGNPFPQLGGKPTKYLLQFSVVLLGFGMNLGAVYETGKDGLVLTVITVAGTLLLGFLIGRSLGIRSKTSTLVSSGTAICGGSAIAAVGPSIDAEPDDMSVALGTVFVLNAAALFLFPWLGSQLGLSQQQFGLWAAIAIHDTSSVVGAASAFGADALSTATTVKLTRALWIIPVALFFAAIYSSKNAEGKRGISIPWFILFFVIAAALRTYAPPAVFPSVFDALINLAKAGMIVTLFLIGTSLSGEMLKRVGFRPLLLGIILWLVISSISLWAVTRYWQ